MSCDFITKGKRLGCLEGQGGVKNFYFALYADYGISATNQVATNLGSLSETYKYEVTGSSHGLTETPTADWNNGTLFFTQVVSAQFPNIEAELQNEIFLLMRNRLVVFVEDYNGNIQIVGLGNGAKASNGSKVTGLASADLNGYTLEVTAEEKEMSPLLNDSAKTALLATVVNSYIGDTPSV
jgi:hypothetical protein